MTCHFFIILVEKNAPLSHARSVDVTTSLIYDDNRKDANTWSNESNSDSDSGVELSIRYFFQKRVYSEMKFIERK